MLLDVPFVPEGDYPEFLAARKAVLSMVHFGLADPAVCDARQRLTTPTWEKLIDGLNSLASVDRYVLMNTRFHELNKYRSAEALRASAKMLAKLKKTVDLTGVIFCDAYYLQALSDSFPDLAGCLEAVPSVNLLIDSAEHVFGIMDMIAATHFLPPKRIVLDRNLNRNLRRLAEETAVLRHEGLRLDIHLLANEGCLLRCPYKLTHDTHIGLVNEGLCDERTFHINRELGCIRQLINHPEKVLQSPFIRPEDIDAYKGHVHGIKICGRNKGIVFLKRVIQAYEKKQYLGNLLDLMDTMEDLAHRLFISNQAIPPNFLEYVGACSKNCQKCRWCHRLIENECVHRGPELPHL